MNGRTVRNFNITGNHNSFELNVAPGIYVIQMQFTDGIGSTKLIVE
jgi:hypothetical protein